MCRVYLGLYNFSWAITTAWKGQARSCMSFCTNLFFCTNHNMQITDEITFNVYGRIGAPWNELHQMQFAKSALNRTPLSLHLLWISMLFQNAASAVTLQLTLWKILKWKGRWSRSWIWLIFIYPGIYCYFLLHRKAIETVGVVATINIFYLLSFHINSY